MNETNMFKHICPPRHIACIFIQKLGLNDVSTEQFIVEEVAMKIKIYGRYYGTGQG